MMKSTRELIIRNKENTCFDPIMLSEEQIEEYLREDVDHIVLTDSQVKQVACGRITDLVEYLADSDRIYYECHPISRQAETKFPIVRISGGEMDFYVLEHDLRKALRNRKGQGFAQRPPSWNFMTFIEDHVTGQLMSKSTLRGGSLVSALHCQAGTARQLYQIITYRVEVSGQVSEGETHAQTNQEREQRQRQQRQEQERRPFLSNDEKDYLDHLSVNGVTSATVARVDRDDHGALIYVELYDGEKYWLKNGWLHRENDLPAFEHPNGARQWFINGLKHREHNLPAEIHGNVKEWWFKGIFYRAVEDDGPDERLFFPRVYVDKNFDIQELPFRWKVPKYPKAYKWSSYIDPKLIFIQHEGPVTIKCFPQDHEVNIRLVGPVSLFETIIQINEHYKLLPYETDCPYGLEPLGDGIWELISGDC